MGKVARGGAAVKQATPKLAEIASRIEAHLKRFEADPTINVMNGMRGRPFWLTRAKASGRFLYVTYVYDVREALNKSAALAYLGWLDAGNVGKHFEMPKDDSR